MAKKGAAERNKARKAGKNTAKARGPGRPKKTAAAASARITEKLADLGASRRRVELLSLVSYLFCEGKTKVEMEEAVCSNFSESYAPLLQGENLWDLLREAASLGLFTHTPRDDLQLTKKLQENYPWLGQKVVVCRTAASEALARQAALRLLAMVQEVRRLKGRDPVHVGFAGGMTLRAVAEKLAELLNHPHPHIPDTLVFHAMVASFGDDDFYADPNSFITYFVARNCRVKVRLVRLPLPGIIESARYEELQKLPIIDSVFHRRNEIDIIVTSGSLWSDEWSTLRTYLKVAAKHSRRGNGASDLDESQADEVIRQFDTEQVVGDLLWHPINERGPVDVDLEYKVTTLMELGELPGFIENGGSVLLVMGCSGMSRKPKSRLLKAILDLHPEHNWVTDVVTDSPTVEGIYFQDVRNEGAPARSPGEPS